MSDKGTNLDPWYDSYADRTAGLSASEVRALFAVASRPEVVSLAGGMPYVSALPRELVTGAIDRVMADGGAMAMQYGSGQGTPAIREHIMQIMAMEGIRGSADDVVVTTGSQQALDLVTRLFVNPGDCKRDVPHHSRIDAQTVFQKHREPGSLGVQQIVTRRHTFETIRALRIASSRNARATHARRQTQSRTRNRTPLWIFYGTAHRRSFARNRHGHSRGIKQHE